MAGGIKGADRLSSRGTPDAGLPGGQFDDIPLRMGHSCQCFLCDIRSMKSFVSEGTGHHIANTQRHPINV